MRPVIFGLSGTTLKPDERAFFLDAQPAGFILFARNIADVSQVSALTNDLRSLAGRDDLPILVDQEGGRVARLRPPLWPEYPAAEQFDRLYRAAPASALAAARSNGQALGHMLAGLGISVNCAPVLDIRHASGHDIVGDRSFGHESQQVAALGRAILDGMEQAGVAGVIKHVPGHGRASCDSHHDLPHVDASLAELAEDMAPFAALSRRARIAMTAHILYQAWDPDLPATLSAKIVDSIIRQQIGFDGLLLTDDIEMSALAGPVPTRVQMALAAGCDIILHCSGDIKAMQEVAAHLPLVSAMSAQRLERALVHPSYPANPEDIADVIAHRDALLALAA